MFKIQLLYFVHDAYGVDLHTQSKPLLRQAVNPFQNETNCSFYIMNATCHK